MLINILKSFPKNPTFKLLIAIVVNWHNSTSISREKKSYSFQNTFVNLLINQDCNDQLKCVVLRTCFFSETHPAHRRRRRERGRSGTLRAFTATSCVKIQKIILCDWKCLHLYWLKRLTATSCRKTIQNYALWLKIGRKIIYKLEGTVHK